MRHPAPRLMSVSPAAATSAALARACRWPAILPPPMARHDRSATDVAIIGAGPVGLFAVFECGMLGLRCHVFDALDMPGGQCAALYPEKPIYDIPGYPRIEAAELIERLAEQAAPFAPVYHLGHRGRRGSRRCRAAASASAPRRHAIEAGAVIVAAGVGAFGPNRPPLAGIEAYRGQKRLLPGDAARGFPRPARGDRRRRRFGGRLGAVAGRGRGAVMVVHRRAKFRAAPEIGWRGSSALADAGRIELVMPYQLHGLEGDGGRARAVIVADLDGAHAAARGRRAAAVLRPGDESRADRAVGPGARPPPHRGRSRDLRHLGARHLRDRRHRDLSRQAQADPVRASPRRRWRRTRSIRWSIPARRCISNIRRRRGVSGAQLSRRRAVAPAVCRAWSSRSRWCRCRRPNRARRGRHAAR